MSPAGAAPANLPWVNAADCPPDTRGNTHADRRYAEHTTLRQGRSPTGMLSDREPSRTADRAAHIPRGRHHAGVRCPCSSAF